MKRILCVLAVITLLTGLVNAQQIDLTSVSPEISPGIISTDVEIQFDFSYNNSIGPEAMLGLTNGYSFWLSGGTRSAVDVDSAFFDGQAQTCLLQDGGRFVSRFSNDGSGADTIGLGTFVIFGAV